MYIWYDRPTGYRIFLYALLFYRHLSTFHGTLTGQAEGQASPKKRGSVAPLSLTRQGKPGFSKEERERRATESDETREARLLQRREGALRH